MPSPLLNFSHTEICDFITKAGNHHEQALQGIPIQHPYALIKQSRLRSSGTIGFQISVYRLPAVRRTLLLPLNPLLGRHYLAVPHRRILCYANESFSAILRYHQATSYQASYQASDQDHSRVASL